MKLLGSKPSLVASADSKSEKSMLTTWHLPESNIIQTRRASMCQQINRSLEQLLANEVVPFYPLTFPHGLDFASGAYVYEETIPRWWYLLSHQQEPSVLPLAYLGLGAMFPLETEIVLLGFISSPVNYVQCSRAQYHVASSHWWQVVTEISDQYLVPPRRLSWWGWHTTTRGPPTIFPTPGHVYDPAHDDGIHRHLGMHEEFEVDAQDLLNLHLPHEVTVMRQLGYQSDEWVFWRAAQLALEQGIRDSEELGWPPPVGITGNPMGFRLLYDDEDYLDSETLSLNGSDTNES